MPHHFLLLATMLMASVTSSFAAESSPSTQQCAGQPATAAEAAGNTKKLVLLDNFYHHQTRNGIRYHYTWDDVGPSGYSKLGALFADNGAVVEHLAEAPTAENLRRCSVYIIVNPDTVQKADDHKPNYITTLAADIIQEWVSAGGVLMLMNNDKDNAEFEHFNILAKRFGITFNEDGRNEAPHHEPDQMQIKTKLFADHPILQNVSLVSMRGICTLKVQCPAKAIVTASKEAGEGSDVIMATSSLGKGRVFAVGDPWLYNEYIHTVDNYKAAENLVQWLMGTVKPAKQNAPAGLPSPSVKPVSDSFLEKPAGLAREASTPPGVSKPLSEFARLPP
jgi:unsaturated rhamnogalacturonyl hydrolase